MAAIYLCQDKSSGGFGHVKLERRTVAPADLCTMNTFAQFAVLFKWRVIFLLLQLYPLLYRHFLLWKYAENIQWPVFSHTFLLDCSIFVSKSSKFLQWEVSWGCPLNVFLSKSSFLSLQLKVCKKFWHSCFTLMQLFLGLFIKETILCESIQKPSWSGLCEVALVLFSQWEIPSWNLYKLVSVHCFITDSFRRNKPVNSTEPAFLSFLNGKIGICSPLSFLRLLDLLENFIVALHSRGIFFQLYVRNLFLGWL